MLEEILTLHQQRKLDEAEQRYRELLAFNPDDPETLHLLGMLRRQRGDGNEALQLVRRAVELAPDRAPYYMTLGAIELHARALPAARADFETAVKLDPNLAGAYSGLAHIALLQGDAARADANFKLADRAGGERAEVLVGQGNLRLSRGDVDGAIRYLSHAAERFPADPVVQASLGRAFLAKQLYAFAEQAFNNALRLKPELHAARRSLAEVLLRTERFDEARPHLEALLAVPDQHAAALAMMGEVFLARGDLGRATTFFRDSLEKRPGQLRVVIALATCLMRLNLLREAIGAWREAVRLAPDDVESRHLLATCCAQAGLADEAEAAWRWVLERKSDHSPAAAGFAALLELRGRWEQAQDVAQTLLEREPQHPGASLLLARAALRAGDAGRALTLAEGLADAALSAPLRRLRALVLGAACDALDRPAAAVLAWCEGRREGSAGPLPKLASVDAPAIAAACVEARRLVVDESVRRPLAVLLGVPGDGVETVARLLERLPGLRLLADRFGGTARVDGFTLGQVHHEVNADHSRRFARRYARPLERLKLAADLPLVDWLPALDARALPLALGAFGRLRVIVVRREPRDGLLNWLAFGGAAGWSCQDGDLASAARRLARLRAHLDAAVAALDGNDVLLLSGDAAVADPAVVLAQLGAFLGQAVPTPAATVELHEQGLGGLPRSLPAASHSRYGAVLSEAFAALS